MAPTILLFILIASLITYLLWILFSETKLNKKQVSLTITILIAIILIIIFKVGRDQLEFDIGRLINNSSPKEPNEVYGLLFKGKKTDCVTIINFKDQAVPVLDCCIWMELAVCPTELKRILALRPYTRLELNHADSADLLEPFSDRPKWWKPQILGAGLTRYSIRFNQDKLQTLFAGKDSSHVFLCDQAL